MFTQESCIKYSKEFIEKIKQNGISIEKAILFGSYALNKQHIDSDIDIALVSNQFTGVGFLDIKLIYKELYEFDVIQPKTFKTDYFNQGDPFIDEIIKYGIILN